MNKLLLFFSLILITSSCFAGWSNTPGLMDSETGAQVTIDVGHHYNHQGDHFFIHAATASLADNATAQFLLDCRTSEEDLHLHWNVITGGNCMVAVSSSTMFTFASSGTVINPLCFNLVNPGTTNVKGAASVTSVTMTPFFKFYTAGGSSAQTRSGGAISANNEEWIVPAGSASDYYLVSIQNLSGGAIPVSFFAEWYHD